MTGPYDDIISLPHHISSRHPRMPRADRAAQFSPFSALSGYEEAIDETARHTEERPSLSEDGMDELEKTMQGIMQQPMERRRVLLTRFVPDERKAGGSYVTESAVIKSIDTEAAIIILADGRKIPAGDIIGLTAPTGEPVGFW